MQFRLILSLAALLFMFGCETGRNAYPVYFMNGYYEVAGVTMLVATQGYLGETSEHPMPMRFLKSIRWRSFDIQKGIIITIYDNSWVSAWPYDLAVNNTTFGEQVLRLNFYQYNIEDIEHLYEGEEPNRRFLFSYDNEELRSMKIGTGQPLSSREVIFILGRDGLTAMTAKEYEDIRTTLKPHPYDPLLCRPEPANNRE